MKSVLIFIVSLLLGAVMGWSLNSRWNGSPEKSSVDQIRQIIKKPLEKYQYPNLSQKNIKPSKIVIEKVLKENPKHTSSLFSFSFDPTLENGQTKKVSGMINIPNTNAKFPLIVMFRGYVDQSIYQTGLGTARAAGYFADNGFITVSPDFLGYGESDKEAEDIFESRFQTYTTALTLLSSLDSIEDWNGEDVFIWGHSNGGQLAITLLEISGKTYPTTLWAPVTKPFPYSILYYTDESEDGGKFIRSELAKFENLYDTDKYSLSNYLDNIKAPLQLHQGSADDAVPLSWSSSFANQLETKKMDITFYTYPGADHNLQPGWNTVVQRDLVFFNKYLK